MKISNIKYYDGARGKICRLGLTDSFLQIEEALLETDISLEERRRANDAGVIHEALDAAFEKATGWTQIRASGIDWSKQRSDSVNFISKIGVEIQVSARSDLLIRDVVHLRNSLQKAEIDVGVIVVPSDRMQRFSPDRTPSFRDAVRYIEQEFKEATTFPIVVIAIEHDAAGIALTKQKRKSER
jgi:NADH:ubiquinone oxidoreductase subunit D